MDAFQMMHYALLGICIVCAKTDVFMNDVFDIKTFDHINDSLFKRVVPKDTKLNTPEEQLWHSHHKTSISQYCEEVNIKRF
jgi:hypothetical protein